jgi:hypothetical protein
VSLFLADTLHVVEPRIRVPLQIWQAPPSTLEMAGRAGRRAWVWEKVKASMAALGKALLCELVKESRVAGFREPIARDKWRPGCRTEWLAPVPSHSVAPDGPAGTVLSLRRRSILFLPVG